jgi:DNA-binding LacI/PurR family transcriptional regulator
MTKQDKALLKLREMLNGTSFPPSSRMPTILELSAKFDMKERPVREAVKVLVGENKLYTVSGKGIFVFDPEVEENKNIMFLVDSNYIFRINEHAENIFLQMEVYQGALKKAKEFGWYECFYSYNHNVKDVIHEYKRQKCSAIVSMASIKPQQLHEISQQIGANRIIDTQFHRPNYNCNEIRVDFKVGINTILEKAYELGHRNIAMFYGDEISKQASHVERFQAFISFCQGKQIHVSPAAMLGTAGTELDGYRKTNTLLQQAPETTLIFAVNDERARGVIHALEDRGITLGKEISVIGFDNAPCAEKIGLSTVAVPRHEVGVRAVVGINKLLRTSQSRGYSEMLKSYPIYRSSLGPVQN